MRNYFAIEFTDEQLIRLPHEALSAIELYLRQLEIISDAMFVVKMENMCMRRVYGHGDERTLPIISDILLTLRNNQPYFCGELVA